MEAESSLAFVVSSHRHGAPSTISTVPEGMAALKQPLFVDAEVLEHSRNEFEREEGITTNTKTTKSQGVPNTNPTPVLVSAWNQLMTSGQSSSSSSVPAMVATFLLAATLSFATFAPDSAWAAMSGGRMGGSFGSSAPRMSAPSRGYGGGGGGGGYYGGPRYGGITVSPIVPIMPGPYFGPTPFYGGGVMAMPFRGPSFFDLIFFGGFAFVALSALTSAVGNVASRTMSGDGFWSTSSGGGVGVSALGSGVTVAQMSVALEVPNRDDRNSILSVLDRLAQTARTDERVGVQNLTSQVALELLRRKSSIVSAYTESKNFRGGSTEQAQREFNSRAVRERGKFEEETVSRYGGVDYSSGSRPSSKSSDSGMATMAVVTLVIAIEGDSTKLPSIRSMADVEEALRRLASDAKVDDCLMSAEILWTPQDRSETLTQREVIADYPDLRSV
ncbi:hypothetical protein ACA910_018228 [Epithemia clementina (nom. ined.)]